MSLYAVSLYTVALYTVGPCGGLKTRSIRQCAEELGPIDLMVANAGVGSATRPGEMDSEEIERVLRINFMGAVWSVEAVLPQMLARRSGHLVAVSSVAGFNATKSVVASFTRATDGSVSVGTISINTSSTILFDSAADAAGPAGVGVIDAYRDTTGAIIAGQNAPG